MPKVDMTRTDTRGIDSGLFRSAVGQYASGITVITGRGDDGPIGFTCQSFYSVSVDPPLVSFSVMKTSTTYPRIRDTGKFAVNVLSREQEAVSSQFARKGTDKWANVQWTPSEDRARLDPAVLSWAQSTNIFPNPSCTSKDTRHIALTNDAKYRCDSQGRPPWVAPHL